MPDRKGDGGEGRLVFGLTDGPGDDPASAPLPMTVIFEYAQDGPALDWAKRWHALGDVPAAELARALVALTDRFVAKGAIAQIRTADALTGPMLLHEFHVVSGEIVAANVRNSPAWGRVPPDALRSFAAQNADAIEQGTALLPSAWWASSSATADEAPSWVADVPAHDELLRQTCGGCHAQSDTGFQIDPRAKGTAKLSRFLSDPTKESDDIRRRVEWMQLEIFSAR